MDMSSNPVILHIGDSPWTRGGVCLAIAAVMFVAWIILLPIVARRFGEISRLTSDEAATLSMVGYETSYVKPEAIVHGPAAGKQWQVEITIGDLRAAWRARQYGIFVGLPAFSLLFSVATALAGLGWAAFVHATMIFGILGGFSALVTTIMLFMMWAAVYTKLE
jgi:hypothetical protein